MNDDFMIRSAMTDDDVVRVADFLYGIFGHGRNYILTHPGIQRPRAVRYVERNGAVVAGLVIESMTLTLGGTSVPAGRIENVGTQYSKPRFRNKGSPKTNAS